MRDVGRAVAEASNRNLAGYQNNELGIILNVFKQAGANVIDTVDKIKELLPRLTANIPPAMTVETILDRTTTIRASVHDVEFTMVLTIGLVVMVVLLFLRNFWATLIPSITIPLALLGSFAAMYALNFSLNNLSLMALTIAIGFVVDDAVVVIENIYRHIEQGSSPFEAALKGSPGNRLHGIVDQPVSRCRVHSALPHGRDHRPPVSRIRRDRHRLDCRLGRRLANARTDAVLALP